MLFVASGALAGFGLWLGVLASVPHRAPIAHTVARLHRSAPLVITKGGGVGGWVVRRVGRDNLVGSRQADLAVLDRSAEQYGAHLAFAAVVGVTAPAVVATSVRLASVEVGVFIP